MAMQQIVSAAEARKAKTVGGSNSGVQKGMHRILVIS